MRAWRSVDRLVEDAVERAVFPGAALIVGAGHEVLHRACYGATSARGPSVTPETVYDLSSLTKPLATTAAVARLLARGDVDLDTAVVDVLADFGVGPSDDAELRSLRRAVDLRLLLSHASGLPAWRAFWQALQTEEDACGARLVATNRGRERIEALALAEPLERAPGAEAVYSDVGFIVVGAMLEELAGGRLDAIVTHEVLRPLGLTGVGFLDPLARSEIAASGPVVAPCGECPWRGETVCGAVQDENAFAMGGIAGHAGLFANLDDVQVLVAEWVEARRGRGRVLDPEVVETMWTAAPTAPGSTWRLGWDTPTPGASSAGRLVSSRSVGHLGYTGTSVWIDLERGVHVILLSNRLQPNRENVAIRELRPRLHDAIFEVVG